MNNLDYEEKYHQEIHKYLLKDEEYYTLRAKLAKERYFKNISESKKILEFGCGLGQNIFNLNNAEGYDISKFSLGFNANIQHELFHHHPIRYGPQHLVYSCSSS